MKSCSNLTQNKKNQFFEEIVVQDEFDQKKTELKQNPIVKTLIFDKCDRRQDLNEFLDNEYAKPLEDLKLLSFPSFSKTNHEKKCEYTLKLVNPSKGNIENLTTQLKYRLQEGNGEAIYEIGIEEDGNHLGLSKADMHSSLKTLYDMASRLKADVIILNITNGFKGKIAEAMVRQNKKEGIKIDIRIALMGDHESGKSTLVGVLTSGSLDDGNGSARIKIFNHKHEFLRGQTSSISYHVLGFDSQGKITNHSNTGNQTWAEIVDQSTKIIQLMDLGEKTIYDRVCSLYPEYVLLIISIKKGITKNVQEYFKLAIALKVPLILVLTHLDVVIDDDVENFIYDIKKFIMKNSTQIPFVIKNEKDVVLLSRMLQKEKPIPIFLISNVVGTNMELFKTFLNLLPVVNLFQSNSELYTEFFIHDKYEVQGAIILAGTVIKGCLKKYQILHLGPDWKGKFYSIEVLEIRCSKVTVKSAICGQSCTVMIKLGKTAVSWLENNKNKDLIRRGMVLVEGKSNPKAAYEFSAEIWLWDQNNEEKIMKKTYQPVINTQTTRQSCKVIDDKTNEENDTQLVELTLTKKVSKSIDNKKNRYFEEKKSNDDQMLKITNYKLSKGIKHFANSFQFKEENIENYGNMRDNKEFYTFDVRTKMKLTRHKKKYSSFKIYPSQKNVLRLRFMYYPEYILVGQKLLINDASLKAIGWIKEIFY